MSDRTAAPRRRAARGRGPELRGEVLRAAMDLLTETGDEDAVSLRAVAARVGVSVPSIYLHFTDKQALLDAVCEEVFEALHLALREAAAGADTPFEALRRQGVAYVRFALANPEHYRIVLMQRDTTPPDEAHIAAGAFGHLVGTVAACVQDGIFEGEPLALAVRLWAAAHGVAALLIAQPAFPWPDVDELVEATIVMAGLGLVVQSRLRGQPLEQVLARLQA